MGRVNLDEAIQAFPIVSWLSAHTEVRDGGGQNLYADCPVCSGKQKLFVRKGSGYWRCFRCTDGGHANGAWKGRGSLVGLVAHLEGLDTGQAIRFIGSQSGIPDLPVEVRQVPYRKIPKEAIPLTEIPKDHQSHVRLRARGLTHLIPNIYACVTGPYADRWILPCNFLGTTDAIEAKSYYKGVEPKALYPTWFYTPDHIYTTYQWDHSLGFAVVTESIFDAETFRQNGIGIYGSNLLPGQFDRLLELRELGITTLFWALDPDAQRRQAQAIVSKTAGLFRNYTVSFVHSHVKETPSPVEIPKLDPNAAGFHACWEALDTAVPIDSELDLLGDFNE